MNDQSARPDPLARLFLSAAGILVDKLHVRLGAQGWREVRHSWGFVISRLSSGPATVNELAEFLGVSKQAASKAIGQMQSHGLVHVTNNPEDGRSRLVELTPEGEKFRSDVEAIYADIESSWADAIGRDELELIRERLTSSLTAMHGGTLPPPAPLK